MELSSTRKSANPSHCPGYMTKMSSMNLSQRKDSTVPLFHLYDRNYSMLAMNIFANVGGHLVPYATSDFCL